TCSKRSNRFTSFSIKVCHAMHVKLAPGHTASLTRGSRMASAAALRATSEKDKLSRASKEQD
ncbi:hypothetical protein, partial [Sinorhizobium mexicanum]|uniref:hypothetical protein n=1 Tax=Sinorhizobium mexicanum TaxID=375549 RepID=UPI001AE10396